MDPERMRKIWNARSRSNPMHYIVDNQAFRDAGSHADAFFRSGRAEVAQIMSYLESIGVSVARSRALDFGCGMGRLTQGLAEYFEEVIGVDVSDEMVKLAEGLNPYGPRVRFVTNVVPNLGMFQSGWFDFAVTDIVLQHVPPPLEQAYLGEIVRLLSPSGIAVAQLPGKVVHKGMASFLLARRAGSVHGMDPQEVANCVEAAGGRIIRTRRSELPYAGLSDILPGALPAPTESGQGIRSRLHRLLADQRPSLGYVIGRRT